MTALTEQPITDVPRPSEWLGGSWMVALCRDHETLKISDELNQLQFSDGARIKTCVPTITTQVRHRDCQRPAISGYIPTWLPSRDYRLAVLQFKGVYSRDPIYPVNETRFAKQLESFSVAVFSDPLSVVHRGIVEGARVRIKYRALANYEGRIVKINGKRKIVIVVELFSRMVEVSDLTLADVEPL